MTLLKDNNYKSINVALLSLENDIKNKVVNFDTTVIDKQLEDINKRISEINGESNSSAEINDLRTSVENISAQVSNNSTEISNIEQQLSNVFSAKSVVEDLNTATEPGVYYWTENSANRPNNYGVLLVTKLDGSGASGSEWINQMAYSTTNNLIYFRQRINNNEWRAWQTIAYEDITKTYTLPTVTSATRRYIKLGTFPWHFAETVRVVLGGNSLEDTIEFNVLGGNGNAASLCGWYTTNTGNTEAILVAPTGTTFAANVEVWLRIEQFTTCTVKLSGSAKAAQYFNTNAQLNNTQTVPSNSKVVSEFKLGKGFFGHNDDTLNCYDVSGMVSLGFTKDEEVGIAAFAQALTNFTGTNRGQVHFTWNDNYRAYIKATAPFNAKLEINGGTIIFHSRYKNVSEPWNTFEAEYVNRIGEVFSIGMTRDDATATGYVRKLATTSNLSSYRTNQDEGYLCKHYDIGGHTNQAYNVILLGKIPDPASTAAPATPSTSWDIDVDFYFVRSQGHKASWCNVKAGYGYSNAWRKYGLIETFGVDSGSNYTNPFYLVTLKYNNEWYIGVKHTVDIDGNYAARVHNVNIAGGRNPSTVANTPLANMLKAIGYLKTDGTVLNSEINSSMVELPSTYAPTIQKNSSLVIRNTTDVTLDSFGKEPLSIGTITGDNLGIDGNEIQARTGSKASSLYINGSGGIVHINDTKASNGGLKVYNKLVIPIGAPATLEDGCIWIER